MAATGFKIAGGADIDTLFAVRVSAPVAATGFKIAGGADINTLYEPRGSTTPRANTGYRIAGGTDLALVFKDIAVASNTVNIDNQLARSFVTGTTATAQYRLTSGGDISATTINNTLNDVGDWISPKSNFSLYSARASLVSGTVTSGALGTWLNLATDRTWTLASPSVSGLLETVITVEIRTDADGIVRDTATITLQAERT